MLDVNLDVMGAEWLAEEIENLCDEIVRTTPVAFSEQNRYLPESVTSRPGPMSFDVNPFMREIVDCADPRSTVREVNLMKGVQTTYTTLLESILFHFMAEVKTGPAMLVTAEKELATARVENNILPMLQQSGFADIIRSSDEGNARKTGKTAHYLQWEGGGYMVPIGANNPSKMRMFSILLMLKDEIDAWPDIVGRDGDPDKLTDDRCSAFWPIRKIFRGSTPLIKDTSKIFKQYNRGDKRKYFVKCLGCGFEQTLRWSTQDKETGVVGGIVWDVDEHGTLDEKSVHYACAKCGHKHYEHDKPDLFASGRWKPTAKPREPGIRSYHLPALYSPYGFASWAKCVSDYLDSYDPINRRVRDIGKYQAFYNNILGEPFEIIGQKVTFQAVSGHRRAVYRLGEIPNNWAIEFAGSPILFLTCQVDVHKSNLAVAVMGWTVDAKCFVIDYWRLESEDCTELSSPVWATLQTLIEEKEYIADDGKTYRIQLTLIDAGYSNDTVVKFCSQYEGAVYPILGRDRPAKNQTIKEFAPFKTQDGTTGYRILVDHYKDRLGPVLRREWNEGSGVQLEYHLNVPIDASDKQIKELTSEYRRKKVDAKGQASYEWYRPNNVDNELFDLLVYGHAAVEMIAWDLCINTFELETINWRTFWEYVQIEKLYYND